MKWRVKNWHQFQHFKDRRPPWIKLYRDLLDDPDWHALKPDAAKALVMLWLIASEDDGNLPDPRKLAFRMRMTERQVIQLLNSLTHWLEQVDISAISPGYHDDAPERETYSEETETESAPAAPTAKDELAKVLDSEHVQAVIDHRNAKRAKLTPHAAKLLAAKFSKWRNPNEAADAMIANGWQGFEVEWMQNRKTNGHDPPPTITTGAPEGFREATTAEYTKFMQETYGPKFDHSHPKFSRWQFVPKDWPVVVPLKREA